LIYASLSAYGQDGPLSHRGAYDHIVQAMAGIMPTTGMPGSEPTKVGAPYIDYATGLNGAFAILAALHERHRTGRGQRVDVAMLDTALLLMANHLVQVAMTGENPAKTGNEAFSGSPSSGCYATQEGQLMLAANNERQFVALCAAIGRPELASDARFAAPQNRRRHQAALRQEFERVFATRSAAAWEDILDTAGVPAARIRTIHEVLEEGQPDARGLLSAVRPVSQGPAVRVPTAGFKLNGEVLAPDQPPQRVGADTESILQSLGYNDAEIADMRRAGVV
jgi:crotonobetainyl-CoA:carnitine CoA-transferase CaiB-like acyl-CoA transferase